MSLRSGVRVLVVLGLLVLLTPSALWAYHTERAGRLIEQALQWPEPRHSDALPYLRDAALAERASRHLESAIRWRAGDAYARRRLAAIDSARGDYAAAAETLEKARQLKPSDPLVAWELSLAYEQLYRRLAEAPRETLLPDLLSVVPQTPALPLQSPTCTENDVPSCYVGLIMLEQAYAASPSDTNERIEALFMHPPSSVRLSYPIGAERTALSFLLGLDPDMRGARTDGAGFEIWLTEPAGTSRRLFNRMLDRSTAVDGWTPAWIDLQAWAGQTVTLELRTTGGEAGDTTDDWYAWGNIFLTTPEAAQLSQIGLKGRIQDAWRLAGVDPSTFAGRGDQAWERGDYAGANAWYRRMLLVDAQPNPSRALRAAIAAIVTDRTLPSEIHPSQLGVLAVEPIAELPAHELRWISANEAWQLEFGDRLAEHPGPDPSVGVMWWNGAAVAIVEAPQEGDYLIEVTANHVAPTPIELQIEVDLRPIGPITLARGDGTWEDVTFSQRLSSGTHVIGIRFLNDGVADGTDRNAVLSSLKVVLQR